MLDTIYRLKLRLFKGQSFWHNRRFPPSFKTNYTDSKLQFSYQKHTLKAKWFSSLEGGLRCNIILSGPSIKTVKTPSLFGDSYNIWVNGSAQLAIENRLRPSLYLVSDPSYIKSQTASYLRYASFSDASLTNFACVSELLKRVNVPKGRFYVYEDPKMPFRELCETPLAYPENAIRGGHTVAITAIRAALRMGFREIYVFGFDLGGNSRFYKEEKPEPNHLQRDIEMIHREMKQVTIEARLSNSVIWNCSLDSRLDASILPCIDPNYALELSRIPLRSRSFIPCAVI